MTKRTRPPGDYVVGYGKPPRKNQFLPGQSGNPQGRGRKKALESPPKTIERILSEVIDFGGRKMTKLELACEAALNRVIKSGNIRDLERLIGMLGDLGIQAKLDWAAEQRQAGEEVMAKISRIVHRQLNVDPDDTAARMRDNRADAELIMSCDRCAPALRKRWKLPEFLERAKRGVTSALYDLCTDRKQKEEWIKATERGKTI